MDLYFAFNNKLDIHSYEYKLADTYKNLEEAKVFDENKASIRDFGKLLESMDLNKGRVA